MMNAMIILNYNDFENTFNYINRIKDYTQLDYILIVDNCSTDDSFQRLSELKNNKINIVRTDGNNGYAYGNNFGVRYLEENHIIPENLIISNPDIEIAEDDFNRLLVEFDHLPSDTFAISGMIYDRNMKVNEKYAWKQLSYGMIIRESTFILNKILRCLKIKGREYGLEYVKGKKQVEVDVIPGCFFVAKYQLWKKINGFTEGTFLYFEEDVLAAKAHREKYHNYVITDVKIKHFEGGTVNKNIASNWKKMKTYFYGCLFYLQNVLKIGMIKACIFKIVYHISMVEKSIYIFLVRGIKKEYKNPD